MTFNERRVFIIGFVVIGLIAALFVPPVYRTLGYYPVIWIYDIATILTALVGSLLALRLYRSFERGETHRVIWGNLALGLLLWTLGETVWAIYELILTIEAPYPSVADLAWSIGYIPLFLALLMRYRSLGAHPAQEQLIIGSVFFTVMVGISTIFIVIPMLSDPSAASLVEKVLNVAYPLGDLAIAFSAGLVVMLFAGGALSRAWMIISAGFFLISFADLLFSYTTWNDLYLHGPDVSINPATAAVDILYFAGYVVIVFGIYRAARLQRVL